MIVNKEKLIYLETIDLLCGVGKEDIYYNPESKEIITITKADKEFIQMYEERGGEE